WARGSLAAEAGAGGATAMGADGSDSPTGACAAGLAREGNANRRCGAVIRTGGATGGRGGRTGTSIVSTTACARSSVTRECHMASSAATCTTTATSRIVALRCELPARQGVVVVMVGSPLSFHPSVGGHPEGP